MPRIQGLAESGIITADTLIKTGAGEVFHLTLAYKGVTAGELCTLIDGTNITGTDMVAIVFSGANGTIELNWAQGKRFTTGLFFNKGATAGSVFASLTYK